GGRRVSSSVETANHQQFIRREENDRMDNISLDRIIQRSQAVATFDRRTYDEIAHDPRALPEAAIVVVAVAIASGIGGLTEGADGLVGGIILSLLGWVIAAMVVYFVGTRITGTPTTSGS